MVKDQAQLCNWLYSKPETYCQEIACMTMKVSVGWSISPHSSYSRNFVLIVCVKALSSKNFKIKFKQTNKIKIFVKQCKIWYCQYCI